MKRQMKTSNRNMKFNIVVLSTALFLSSLFLNLLIRRELRSKLYFMDYSSPNYNSHLRIYEWVHLHFIL